MTEALILNLKKKMNLRKRINLGKSFSFGAAFKVGGIIRIAAVHIVLGADNKIKRIRSGVTGEIRKKMALNAQLHANADAEFVFPFFPEL